MTLFHTIKELLIDYSLTIAVIVTACSSVTLMYRYSEALHGIERSTHIINGLTRLELSLVDTETGQRGYIITGNPGYLDIYRVGIDNYQREMADLLATTNGDHTSADGLLTLSRLANPKFLEMEKTLSLRQQSFEDAKAEVNTHLGKNLMEAFRQTTDRTIAQQNENLLMFDHKAVVAANWAAGSLIGGIVALFFALRPGQRRPLPAIQ